MSLRPRALRSADSLGLTLAITGSPRDKAAKRIERLRQAGPQGYLWTETEQEFGIYREKFPKPENVCVPCLRGGQKQVVSGRLEYVDGWGTRGWVRTCPVHGTNPSVKQYWSIGPKEKRIVRAIAHVIRTSRLAAKGSPPVREVGWVALEKDLARVYGLLKGVA